MRDRTAVFIAIVLGLPGPAGADRVEMGTLSGVVVRRAVAAAALQLERPSCDAVLDEFADATGAPLRRRLESLDLPPQDYLRLVVFADGYGSDACQRSDTYAFTAPGSRVVYVCAGRFRELQAREPVRAEAVVIHEMLHTLGLGEDPPTSREITARVLSRCGS